ncbi:hypothetical protein DRQ25_12575 [Candidatus Fermentibacteria bacterium]|nr:MAG: hypothetical protein DRQ25_12575 [Candidatus Fermentibacteria bacterium]
MNSLLVYPDYTKFDYLPQNMEGHDLTLLATAWKQIREAAGVSFILFRIMVPVVIAVKILGELGLVKYIATAFEPVMSLVGLPGEMGLVWATAVVTNMYGGIVIFASIAPGLHMSTAQITVIACMILVAHSMAVETTIARKTGVRIRFMIPFRILCALLFGFILNTVYTLGGFLQEEGHILWEASPGNDSLGSWAFSQLQNLAVIFFIVLVLIILMKILDRLGITRIMNTLLEPVLTSMGIGRSASAVTILGMVLGISYGGGLIIRDVNSGKLSSRDVFFSISLMGLSHAIVEDTLLMMSLGGSITGVLFGRIAFTWIVISCLVRFIRKTSDTVFYRYFFRR